jgi:hypothetical protein
MRFSLTGSRCRAGWEKFSNFRGRLGQLTKIDSIFWFTEVLLTSVGSRKLTNFSELSSKPMEVKYPTELSSIPIVLPCLSPHVNVVSVSKVWPVIGLESLSHVHQQVGQLGCWRLA